MSIDVSKKKITMIDGLASKPPEEDVHSLWKGCIIENIRVDDNQLADQLEAQPEVFVSADWANATPHHIEDDAEYVGRLRVQVDKVIEEKKKVKHEFHRGIGEAIGAFFQDRGLDVVKLLAGALTVKDDVIKAFLRETELYDKDQYITDRMRRPLEDALRNAWKKAATWPCWRTAWGRSLRMMCFGALRTGMWPASRSSRKSGCNS